MSHPLNFPLVTIAGVLQLLATTYFQWFAHRNLNGYKTMMVMLMSIIYMLAIQLRYYMKLNNVKTEK